MKPSDLARALQQIIPTGKPVFIWGPPGVGKSSIVHQAVRNLFGTKDLIEAVHKRHHQTFLLDIRAVLLDPVDLRGIPSVNGDRTTNWCPPSFWPQEGKVKGPGVIFLDELAQAPTAVQSACLQGVLDYQIGECKIARSWSWVAASNRMEDKAGAHRVITPLLNRFVHLDLEVDYEDWNLWAIGQEIEPEVRGFMKFRSEHLFAKDFAKNGDRAFATPRAWEMLSKILPNLSDDLIHQVAEGCVGKGVAAEFVAFTRVYRKLPDPDKILENAENAHVPDFKDDPSILVALCTALADRCKDAPAKKLDAVATYALRLPPEFGTLLMRDGAIRNNDLCKTKAGSEFVRKHRDILYQPRN